MKVRLEPIGETIDCAPEESILDAAFRQGYNLAYGCREGQCSACKCFLLEGDVALKRHSTFALSDSERSSGYALMCRAMPERDVVVELLHYDPDSYRLEHAILDGLALVEAVEPLTHDIALLALRVVEPVDFGFVPGQYVDLWIPDSESAAKRSFSVANLPGDGRLELIIKRYPGGRLSGMLGERIRPGDEIRFTGPYGAFHLRRSERPILMIAGGSGMAPVLSVLRQLSSEGCDRPVRFFYGARTESDLFYVDLISELGSRLGDFSFVSVLSEGSGGRLVHQAVDDFLGATPSFAEPDVYMCGPPPMLEAAEAMLVARRGVDERRIFQDKFTIAAEADPGRKPLGDPSAGASLADVGGASPPPPTSSASERDFRWFEPSKRRATLYEDVTIDTQPSIHRHLSRGWPLSFEDGRGTWDADSTALRSSDWYDFRDPGELWERPFYQLEAVLEQQVEGAIRSAIGEELIGDFSPAWIEFLRRFLQVPAFVEHGLWFALATAARDCLSDTVATCVCLQAAMKQRSAQAIVLYAMDLEAHHGPFPIESAREAFLCEEPWQPVRRLLERLGSAGDWGEVIVASNLCLEPLVGTLLRRELGIRAAAANGDTVTPTLARAAAQEWEWTRGWTAEFVRFLVEDAEFGARNREVLAGWVADWLPQAEQAGVALAPLAPIGVDAQRALLGVRRSSAELLGQVGLQPSRTAPAGSRRRTRGRAAPTPARKRAEAGGELPVQPAAPRFERGAGGQSLPDGNGTYDYVGIVMAKSAEGDAVAAILGRRDGVVVQEQPAFWDICARGRLVIPYDEVSADLGYEIDAYSIQHEMSTHYGRMVATDEALMLFSDPTEAMEHLMA